MGEIPFRTTLFAPTMAKAIGRQGVYDPMVDATILSHHP